MRFRILGSLQVLGDTGQLTMGGPKARAVLAVLLVRRGCVVSVDQLVDVLWEETPPPGVLSALRAHVSRLRSVLESGSTEVRLQFQAPGYVLEVPAGSVDAGEFEDLVGLARGDIAAGEFGSAVALLDTALGLWGGDALAEFAELGPVREEAERLSELRLIAAEERVEALVQLGRYVEVIPELEELVRRFPMRERPAVQLMRAQYGAGRPAEALRAFRDLRGRLVEQLGVEPSTAAQQLHRQILARDPAVDRPVAQFAHNLPRGLSDVVGRDVDLAGVAAALLDAPLVTLTGVAGVGKSRLALEVADQQRSRFPDGVWLCELAPLTDPALVTNTVAASLQVQQRRGISLVQSIVEYLRRREVLLVLDNCEHVSDAVAALVEQILRYCSNVSVLATSRESLAIDGEQLWPLAPLSAADRADARRRRHPLPVAGHAARVRERAAPHAG